MSAVDDIAQPGRFWPRRNYASPSGLKVVSDVPPDLANSLDENGSLVTVDPADWIVCFVPGLQTGLGCACFQGRRHYIFPIAADRILTNSTRYFEKTIELIR